MDHANGTDTSALHIVAYRLCVTPYLVSKALNDEAIKGEAINGGPSGVGIEQDLYHNLGKLARKELKQIPKIRLSALAPEILRATEGRSHGAKYRAARRSLGLKQYQFAALLNLTFYSICRWERGTLTPGKWGKVIIELVEDEIKALARRNGTAPKPKQIIKRLQRLFLRPGRKSWARRVKELRESLGWDAVRFGLYLGVDAATISYWEAAKSVPDIATQVVVRILVEQQRKRQSGSFCLTQTPYLDCIRYRSYSTLWWSRKVRELRRELGLDQRSFSKLVHTSAPAISRWECGHYHPSYFVQLKLLFLARKYGLSFS